MIVRFIPGILLKKDIDIYYSRWSDSGELELGIYHNNQSKDNKFNFVWTAVRKKEHKLQQIL